MLISLLCLTFVNGAREGEPWPLRLRTARVGLYERADAMRLPRDGIVIESARVESDASNLYERFTEALDRDGLTLRQRGACIRQTYARGCNLPILEWPLGALLAFGLGLLGAGLLGLVWRRGAWGAVLLLSWVAARAALLGWASFRL